MGKRFIITQEELDLIEAVRLNILNMYVKDDNINDIITASTITEPLWKLANIKREEIV